MLQAGYSQMQNSPVQTMMMNMMRKYGNPICNLTVLLNSWIVVNWPKKRNQKDRIYVQLIYCTVIYCISSNLVQSNLT